MVAVRRHIDTTALPAKLVSLSRDISPGGSGPLNAWDGMIDLNAEKGQKRAQLLSSVVPGPVEGSK
jgi:hypothetical protein